MNETKRCHRLKSLSVIGGFLDGMEIEFVDGLNCLIGHRGTGKTTVLEFIRYALDEFPRDDGGQARKRVEALVRSNLGDGRIRLALETRDGLAYTIDRSASGESMVLTADGQPTDVRINSAGIFSADIFSQNEVENIADSPQSQLELIDRFAAEEIAEANRKVADLRARLDANTHAIITHAQQFDGLANEVGELDFIDAKIKSLAGNESSQTDGKVDQAQRHRALRGREEQAVKEAEELIRKYSRWLNDSGGRFIQDIDEAFDGSMFDGPNGGMMSRIHETLRRMGNRLDQLFGQAAAEMDSGGRDLEDLARNLKEAHQQQELAFRDLIARHDHARGVDELTRQYGGKLAGKVQALADQRFAMLAAAVAHDVRSILTTLLPNAVAMANEQGSASRAESVLDDVKFLKRTIEAMEQFSKPLPEQHCPESLREMIRQAVQKANAGVIEQGHDPSAVVVDVDDVPAVHLRVTRRLVVLALTNLVQNAIECFADREEDVIPSGRIQIQAAVDGYETRILVRDDGPGVEPEVLRELATFMPTGPNKSKRSSSGWGLSLVHKYVTAHGGTVAIDSEMNLGTTVVLTLPMQAAVGGKTNEGAGG